jgi:WD40 repeat protein
MHAEVTDHDTLLAQEALTALRGLNCSGCGCALDRRKGEYVCKRCHIAHCPYCGSSAQARCRHRIAARTYGVWTIYGEPCAVIPQISVVRGQLLDWSESQKQEVFQDGYPLLDIYGRGLLTQPSRGDLVAALVTLTPGPVIPVVSSERSRNHEYIFAKEPAQALPRIKRALQCLHDGVASLVEITPSARKFLVAELPCGAAVTALCFSPDKRLLAAATGATVTLWDALTGQRIAEKEGDVTISSLTFSPDSARVVAAHAEGWEMWRVADGQSLSRDCSPDRWAPKDPRNYFYYRESIPRLTCSERVSFLHGGASFASIAEAVITVRDTATGCPLLTLDHRIPIGLARFSPDEETLATVQAEYPNHVLLWRVPAVISPSDRANV